MSQILLEKLSLKNSEFHFQWISDYVNLRRFIMHLLRKTNVNNLNDLVKSYVKFSGQIDSIL